MKAIKLLQLSSLFLILNGCGGGSTSPTNTTTPDTSTPPTNPVVEVDNTPPEITLNGDDEITITQGRDFNDPGATAFDINDGDITITVEGMVDNRTLGEYTLTYTATDNAGNTSSISRTIVVEAIEFNDAGLTFCIKRELHYTHDVYIEEGKLPTLEQLETIEKLHCGLLRFGNRIEDFSVLPSLKNLKQITLNGSGYTILGVSAFVYLDPADGEDLTIDLTPFAELKHLESLTIHHLGIENLNRLSNVSDLEIIFPSEYKTVNINLDPVSALRKLKITGRNIIDISFSGSLTSLESLNISSDNLIDISFLGTLTSLESLNIISNNLIDTSAINKLVNLKELFLSGEKLNPDFIPLSQLTQLEFLSLENSNLSNIDFLMNIPSSLTKLSIARNSIEEITGLSNLIQLKELNISRNNISDISKLQNLTQLRELDISWNFISEIDDLVYLSELRELNLHQNCIVGFYVLTQLRYVHFLTMNTTQRSEGCSY